MSNWEEIKHQEREIKRAKQLAADSGVAQQNLSASIGWSARAPALERARNSEESARAGFDWTETALVIAKLREELDEFEEALSEGDSDRAATNWAMCFFQRLISPAIRKPSRRQCCDKLI